MTMAYSPTLRQFCPPRLLAVDSGLRSGLALYEQPARLCWYRATNFGNLARLKRGIEQLLRESPKVEVIVVEGGGPLVKMWEKIAKDHGVAFIEVSAERWRQALLLPREQRDRHTAKEAAVWRAQAAIRALSAVPPRSPLKRDAAEAILIGLWAVWRQGWLTELPRECRPC